MYNSLSLRFIFWIRFFILLFSSLILILFKVLVIVLHVFDIFISFFFSYVKEKQFKLF